MREVPESVPETADGGKLRGRRCTTVGDEGAVERWWWRSIGVWNSGWQLFSFWKRGSDRSKNGGPIGEIDRCRRLQENGFWIWYTSESIFFFRLKKFDLNSMSVGRVSIHLCEEPRRTYYGQGRQLDAFSPTCKIQLSREIRGGRRGFGGKNLPPLHLGKECRLSGLHGRGRRVCNCCNRRTGTIEIVWRPACCSASLDFQ